MRSGTLRAAPSALPTPAFGTLAAPSRRTRRARRGLAVAVAAALAAAAVQAGRSEWSGIAASAERSSAGVVVLDVSGSMVRGSGRRIRIALSAIERRAPANSRMGLVVFSDVGGITLPATAPKSEVRELLRYFSAGAKPALSSLSVPANPWDGTFIGGTLVSSGVIAGEQALERAGVRGGSLYLISDLADDGSDGPIMRDVVARLQRKGVSLTIIPIPGGAPPSDFFRALDPAVVRFEQANTLGTLSQRPAAPAARSSRTGSPLLLASLVAAAGLLVLLCELAFPRLRFRKDEVA